MHEMEDPFVKPIADALGGGSWHEVSCARPLDPVGLQERHGARLHRSRTRLAAGGDRDVRRQLFILGDDVFLEVGSCGFSVHASSRQVACRVADELAREHGLEDRRRRNPRFFLLSSGPVTGLEAVPVAIPPGEVLEASELDLHYGAGFRTWTDGLTRALASRSHGLVLLHGPPGTGKTSFLRHLIGRLLETHCFYFVQPRHFHLLGSPDSMEFWAREQQSQAGRRAVVIIEDAESVLLKRNPNAADPVSSLLNMNDGLLGHYLQFQFVCTVNTAVSGLDPALLRPGRLLDRREFRMLGLREAETLASRVGRPLVGDPPFTLAEIYHGRETTGESPATGPDVGGRSALGFSP